MLPVNVRVSAKGELERTVESSLFPVCRPQSRPHFRMSQDHLEIGAREVCLVRLDDW